MPRGTGAQYIVVSNINNNTRGLRKEARHIAAIAITKIILDRLKTLFLI